MALASIVNPLLALLDRNEHNAYEANNGKLLQRLQDVIYRTWDLGFTSFGGPPVHFTIFYRRFVEGRGRKIPWIDDQTYQELFAVCQALPGPGSTKMLFCMALIHAGFLPALLVFLIWSLPGALGMFALSLGIRNLDDVLPDIVYAFLSGLNAATVGIIALAAVQLAEKSIKDAVTRVLVILGACAGLCYKALWFFPVLIVIGGCTTALWDLIARPNIVKIRTKLRRRASNPQRNAEESVGQVDVQLESSDSNQTIQRRSAPSRNSREATSVSQSQHDSASLEQTSTTREQPTDTLAHSLKMKWGILIIVGFFMTFIAVLVARSQVSNPPLELDLFANMYLAGTVIFGGGPVVIPLLREYVVQPGWVSSRDFLIGLAIIQAFPGPNFNFAVFLGALTLATKSSTTFLGAVLGFVGIFVPGITLAVGFQSCWSVMRTYPITTSALRGMNSTAVGLVFTAVYRLWEIGYLSSDAAQGQSLGKEPFWLVISAITYASNAWFKVPPAVSIVFGGILGLCWYGAIGR